MIEQRIARLEQLLEALRHPWSMFTDELTTRIDDLTLQLINNDNEQTRGRIKALLDVKNMPSTLRYECDSLKAALSEQDAED